MNKTIVVICALLLTTLIATAQKKSASPAKVPFTIANRYFVKNDFQQGMLANPAIYSREEFEKIFGMATVMGKNGTPTPIDFSKQYVIAVIPPATENSVTLKAVSLLKTGSNITLTYSYKEGKKLTYTSQSFLLLIVNAKYKGTVNTIKI
jgi:hypothetical protein